MADEKVTAPAGELDEFGTSEGFKDPYEAAAWLYDNGRDSEALKVIAHALAARSKRSGASSG